jgi:predicted ester cyclase
MSKATKALYRRAWQELMNQRNLAIVDELFAPNYVLHDPHAPLTGREALARFTTALHRGFSDLRLTLDDLLAEGDRVVQRFTLTGTHTGDFLGLSPGGTRLTLTGLALGRITYGQIVEEWRGADWLSWYQQLGLVLEPMLDKHTSKGVTP